MRQDENYLSDIALGLLPRRFRSENKNDRFIVEEDSEVGEMYFV
jgi:hypothetical protein